MEKNTIYRILSFLFVLLLLTACKQEPDFEQLHYEILDLHNASLRAHLDKDVDFFISNLADDYFTAGNGKIRHPSRQEIYNQFSSYLSQTEFKKYKDVEQPVIGFSDDGSLAWCLVRVKVAGTRQVDVDSIAHFKNTWAWITLYKKEGEEWLRLGNVSSHD